MQSIPALSTSRWMAAPAPRQRATGTFAWRQTDGPSVTLSNVDQAEAAFNAPDRRTTLTFELVVMGDTGLAHDDRVTVSAD